MRAALLLVLTPLPCAAPAADAADATGRIAHVPDSVTRVLPGAGLQPIAPKQD